MRHGKTILFILIWCLLPLTTHAENRKIIIPCAELTSIEIEQPPPGYAFPGEACGDKCFYIVFIMKYATAHRINVELNAYKHLSRDLYVGDHFLFTMEPFPIDLPYSQKASTAKVYPSLEDAMNDAREICPNATIRMPDTVRR